MSLAGHFEYRWKVYTDLRDFACSSRDFIVRYGFRSGVPWPQNLVSSRNYTIKEIMVSISPQKKYVFFGINPSEDPTLASVLQSHVSANSQIDRISHATSLFGLAGSPPSFDLGPVLQSIKPRGPIYTTTMELGLPKNMIRMVFWGLIP